MNLFENKIHEIIKNNNWKDLVIEIKKNYHNVIDVIKKYKLLKTTKYDFNYKKPLKILSCLIYQDETDYSLTKLETQISFISDSYLSSFFYVFKLAKKNDILKKYNLIKNEIDKENNLLKLLEHTESVFCGINPLPHTITSIEELAEIFSFFFATSKKKQINIFNEVHEIKKELLASGKDIINHIRLENWITLSGGTIRKIKNEIRLFDNQKKFESVQIESYQLKLQRFKRYQKYLKNNSTNLPISFIKKLPMGNYGIAFETDRPVFIMKQLQNAIFCSTYTPIEKYYIDELCHEIHIVNYFDEHFILNKYSPRDLFNFLRFFNILYIDFHTNLFTNKDISTYARKHSIPLRLPQKKFEQFLNVLLKKDFTHLLKAITLDAKQSPAHIDIQYKPFILDKDLYSIPLGIICNSNFIRNTMFITNSHIEDLPQHPDVIDEEYGKYFKNKISGLSYSFNGVKGELDTIFKIDNIIFISENKNPLFGTSDTERLNTFEYVKKATEQRKRFLSLWNNKTTVCNKMTFLDSFNKCIQNYAQKNKINIPFLADSSTEIVFFCTMGNRSANHLSSSDLHIIFIRQMISFLEDQPIIFAGKQVIRQKIGKKKYYLYKGCNAETLKSFIQASDYKKIGFFFFAEKHKISLIQNKSSN